jgi:hypothetical protein
METHKRVLGILFIVTGTMQAVALIIVSFLFATLFPLIIEQAQGEGMWILEWLRQFGQVFAFCMIFLFSIPSIIAGIGLLNKQKWALTFALILGCFKLFSFPFGTMIGIYAIWVYAEDQKQVQAS